jgi:iron complex transport system substrate-binding protein
LRPLRTRQLGRLCLAVALLAAGSVQAGVHSGDLFMKKRRQQGILTGMPFMANVATRTFVDDLGRKIYLARPPVRIVSLAPSITETLFAVGLDQEIVGVTPFCDYPAQAKGKAKVGYASPNIETIVALKPDLVLAPREFMRADILTKLEQLKITTFILDAKSIEEIPSHVQTLGRIVDRTQEADRVATGIRQRFAEIKARMEPLARPRVLYVLNTTPFITVGPGSYIHQLIELAGGANVAAGARAPYPRLNLEAVLKEDPQILVFPVGSAEGIPESEQKQWQRWTSMSAVKQGRFHTVSSELLNRPGPRIVEGLEALARIIHPEVFDQAGAR